MRRYYKVDPRITKAVVERLYGKYPSWAIAQALGLKPQTITVHAHNLGIGIGKGKCKVVKDETLRKLLLEVVKREVEKIKRELNLEG